MFKKTLLKLIKSYIRGKLKTEGYWKNGGPIILQDIKYPHLIADDWVIIRTVYAGICGSDMTEVKLQGSLDNPLQSFISFPQVMGHEAVGIVEEVGNKCTKLRKGDRVVVNPWFSCEPRGIEQLCPRCEKGDNKHCHNYKIGNLPTGMHLGVTSGYGCFSPFFAVHESQCFFLPEEISFKQAVFADPFSVAFHSILTLHPKPSSKIIVYGLGVIGLLTILCLKKVFKVEHVAAIGRYNFQKELALKIDTNRVFLTKDECLIEEIANYYEFSLYKPKKGLKWSLDGVDGIIDTIASANTLEIGVRVLKSQGKLVFLGVSPPRRFENTPHYFKELEIIGSNAFGFETFLNKNKHAFDFFLEFLERGIIDVSWLITHYFQLEEYQNAFSALTNKGESHAVKVLFKFNKIRE